MDIVNLVAAAARAVGPALRDLVVGSADERASAAALAKAAWAVAIDALKDVDETNEANVEFLAGVLIEHIATADAVALAVPDSASLRDQLTSSLTRALAGFDDPAAWPREQKLAGLSSERLARMFVDQLTDHLLLWGAKGPLVRDLALQLQVDRLTDSGGVLPISEEGEQARHLRAWITLEADPPQIEVHNDSDAPIFEVVPTPLLIAQDLSGEVVAMVGGSPFWGSRASQVRPRYGYVWPMPHMASWANQPLVFSQLHVDFTDAAGRRWRSAHDHVSRLPDQPRAAP